MRILDLAPADELLAAVFPVLHELRPHLTPDLFDEIYAEGHPQGLRFTAAFDDEGRCLGAAGWRVVVTTSALRKLYVDDLVVTAAIRSAGVGHALLSHLEERARELGCRELSLDSGTQRTDAHRFYARERMSIAAFHFRKPLGAG
ncbi:GNAT family N-acetyltransferase [Streptomyces marincola]|uniref:GNAT family N-acetyltransferase n=1 Tax=Streptomyces marincola TaxID=2878388 RepID=A0A1W7D0C1_9ACTN|nr:GNAT family N-acetyltransferase [Streptomyces marincola]ARQ70498.1 GNAT family N-acetyltransferase [Streptomyces marincola]